MNKSQVKKAKKTRRHARIRSQVSGTKAKPRLSVFRSSTAIYAQLIDDSKGTTLAAADSRESKAKTPLERAKDTGMILAKKAADKKITEVVFDRGGFIYKGKVEAIATGAREGGLKF